MIFLKPDSPHIKSNLRRRIESPKSERGWREARPEEFLEHPYVKVIPALTKTG